MRQLAASETGLSPDDIRDTRRTSKTVNDSSRSTDEDGPRPASLATDFDLRQLFTMYADALSRGDIDAIMLYFADDATISISDAVVASNREQIRALFTSQLAANQLVIESPLVTAFYADEGNGTAHGNLIIESRVTKPGGKAVLTLLRCVETYRRTSTGWHCIQRQRIGI